MSQVSVGTRARSVEKPGEVEVGARQPFTFGLCVSAPTVPHLGVLPLSPCLSLVPPSASFCAFSSSLLLCAYLTVSLSTCLSVCLSASPSVHPCLSLNSILCPGFPLSCSVVQVCGSGAPLSALDPSRPPEPMSPPVLHPPTHNLSTSSPEEP